MVFPSCWFRFLQPLPVIKVNLTDSSHWYLWDVLQPALEEGIIWILYSSVSWWYLFVCYHLCWHVCVCLSPGSYWWEDDRPRDPDSATNPFSQWANGPEWRRTITGVRIVNVLGYIHYHRVGLKNHSTNYHLNYTLTTNYMYFNVQYVLHRCCIQVSEYFPSSSTLLVVINNQSVCSWLGLNQLELIVTW